MFFIIAESGVYWPLRIVLGLVVQKKSIQTIRCGMGVLVFISKIIAKSYIDEDFQFEGAQFFIILGLIIDALLYFKFSFDFRL